MRTLLLALALAASTLVATTTTADACGGYMPDPTPAALTVGTWKQRTYVVIAANVTAPDQVTWRRLAPRTFDATMISDGPALDTSRTITLVGPSGTRVVSTTKTAYLRTGWNGPVRQVLVIEGLGPKTYDVAFDGKRPDARWIGADDHGRGKLALGTEQFIVDARNGFTRLHRT